MIDARQLAPEPHTAEWPVPAVDEPVVAAEVTRDAADAQTPTAAAESETDVDSDAESDDELSEPAPAPVSSWHVVSTPADLRDEVLLCGSRGDAAADLLEGDPSLRYDPALTLVGVLTEAYLVGGKWRVPTQFDCSAGRITLDTTRNRVHLGFDAAQLPQLYASTLDKRLKTHALNRQDQAALEAQAGTDWQPLDRMLWRAGLETSAGRLPLDTDLRGTVYLKHWPNLTRLQRTPHALRIAALWATRGAGLLETAELLHIPQRHVFAFYNAALALDLVTGDGSQVRRSQRKSQRNRGLLTRLLGWLHT
jgi:hypothetical protein